MIKASFVHVHHPHQHSPYKVTMDRSTHLERRLSLGKTEWEKGRILSISIVPIFKQKLRNFKKQKCKDGLLIVNLIASRIA